MSSTLALIATLVVQAFHDEQGPGDLSTRLATDCVKLGDVLSLNVNIVLRQVHLSLPAWAAARLRVPSQSQWFADLMLTSCWPRCSC